MLNILLLIVINMLLVVLGKSTNKSHTSTNET